MSGADTFFPFKSAPKFLDVEYNWSASERNFRWTLYNFPDGTFSSYSNNHIIINLSKSGYTPIGLRYHYATNSNIGSGSTQLTDTQLNAYSRISGSGGSGEHSFKTTIRWMKN